MAGKSAKTRIERDSMGEMEVPADALWGASTQRAVLNFPVSGERFSRRFIQALGIIKGAAAGTNAELGVIDGKLADPATHPHEEPIVRRSMNEDLHEKSGGAVEIDHELLGKGRVSVLRSHEAELLKFLILRHVDLNSEMLLSVAPAQKEER